MAALASWLLFGKYLALAAFIAGLAVALSPGDLEARRRAAFRLAAPGFGLMWILGFVLTGLQGHSYLSLWVLGSLVLSLVAINAALYAVGREGRPTGGPAAVAAAAVAACFWLMLFKP